MSCTEATQSVRTQNMSRQITSPESLARADKRKIRKGLRFHQHNSLNIPGFGRNLINRPTISHCRERRIERRNLILFTFDSSQSLHSNSREKGVEKNIYFFDIEKVNLTKQVNTVHVRDQKHELTPPRNRKISL
ncbi:hypothetical protein GQ457_03G002130 [Hibiscus cannabinus]